MDRLGVRVFEAGSQMRRGVRFGVRAAAVATVAALAVSWSAGPATASVGYDEALTETVDAGRSLNAVSCVAGSTTCVAADSDGDLVYATDVSATAAASWNAWAGHGESPGEAVECPTGTLCLLAAGEVDGKAAGNLYRASSLGGSWLLSFKPGNGVDAISCPSTSFCVSGAAGGGFIRYTTNPSGILWSAVAIGTGAMTGVSCLSSSFCAVVDDSGNLHVAVTEEDIEDEEGWVSTDVDGTTALRGVACSSTASCVAVDGSDRVIGLTIGSEGEATPSPQPVAGAGSLTAVSCVGATCAAAGEGGEVFASTDGGANWTQRYGEGSPFTGVSCASASLCAAVARGGEVTAFNPATTTPPLMISTPALPAARVETPYEAQVDADGGTPGYEWSATGLPPGLSIDPATGLISGTPMTAVCVAAPCPQPPADYTPVVEVGDSKGVRASAPLALAVAGNAHVLDVLIAGGGSGVVSSNPPGIDRCGGPAGVCEGSFLAGTGVTLTATPATGSRFTGWSGGGCVGTGPCRLTIAADTTLAAGFEALSPPEPRSLPARLRVRRVRARVRQVRCGRRARPARRCTTLRLVVRGTIAPTASGAVGVRAKTYRRGRRVVASERARIGDGRWRVRLALPGLERHHPQPIWISARFGGSTGVDPGHARRRLPRR